MNIEKLLFVIAASAVRIDKIGEILDVEAIAKDADNFVDEYTEEGLNEVIIDVLKKSFPEHIK
jgi:hypothetical protein